MPDPRFHANRGPLSLAVLARLAEAALESAADGERMISDVAPAAEAGPGTVTYVRDAAHLGALRDGGAAACVTSPALAPRVPEGIACLRAGDPYRAWARILGAFYPQPEFEPGVSAGAEVADDCVLGEGCRIDAGAVVGRGAAVGGGAWIGPGAVLGAGVVVGDRSRIGARACVSHAILGEGVLVHPGACIGQDGFGIAPSAAGHVKVPQLGRVVVGDRVEIGANTCIDRGGLGDTVIGEGTFIDNLCHIAHNVRIGRHVLITAHVAVAGSAEVGDFAAFGGQAGVSDHIRVGAGAQVGPQAGVIRDVEDGARVMGTPAVPVRRHFREVETLRRLASQGGSGKGGTRR